MQARKIVLNYLQEMLEMLDIEHKLKTLEILLKMENDGLFGSEWLDLFHTIVLVSPGDLI